MASHLSVVGSLPFVIGAIAMACSGRGDDLATEMAGRMRTAIPQATVTVIDPMTLRVEAAPLDGIQMNLQNLRASCAAEPAACEASKQNMVQTVVEALAGADARPDPTTLRATLRNAEMLTSTGGPSGPAIHRPFAADVIVVYVFDRPSSMSWVMPHDLEPLGLTEGALHERALANLENALPDFHREPLHPGSRVMSVVIGDSYEASRLLMPTRVDSMASAVEGELVVSVPRRDQVLFTGAANPEDVAALRSATDRIFAQGDHPVSRTLLHRTRTGFAAWP